MSEERVAIVTGASRGIGKAIVENFVRQGIRTVLTARSEDQISEVQKAVDPDGKLTHLSVCDVRKSDQVEATVLATLDRWGRIDILVNNAGLGVFGPVKEYDEEHWDTLFDTNVKGVFLFSKAVIPAMEKTGGSIIMISSSAGRFINANIAAYSATKWALNGFAGCLGMELRESDIQVTLIEPGSVNTHFHNPFDESGVDLMHKSYALEPEEIAEVVSETVNRTSKAWVREVLVTPRSTQKGR